MAIATLKRQKPEKKYRDDLLIKMTEERTGKKALSVVLSEAEIRKSVELHLTGQEAMKIVEQQRKKRREEMFSKEKQAREERLRLLEVYHVQAAERKKGLIKTPFERDEEPLKWYSSPAKESVELFKQISREWGMDFKIDDRR